MDAQVEDTIASAAFRAMEQHCGEINKAAAALEARVRKDRALKAALLEPLVQYACYNAVRRQLQINRDKVWNPPKPRSGMSDVDKIAILARSNLMMFALPVANGILLKDARRGEIAQASEFYGKQAPKRRSAMFVIGGSLIGGMGRGKRPLVGQDLAETDWSPLEKLFVERLRHEAARDPAMALPPTEVGKESYTKHAAARAQRYVEKRFLRDLWRAWRRQAGHSCVDYQSTGAVPAANSQEAA